MQIKRRANTEVERVMSACTCEFGHINHFWDQHRQNVVAKILPGEFYMTSEGILIATTLGSCISACIWDDEAELGGMNHFMLPLTDKEAHEVNWGQRGKAADATRYGNFAMEHLINAILKSGGRRENLRAKVFGGGKVLKKMSDVGARNIAFVKSYLAMEGIPLVSADVGSVFPRKVIFEPITGKVFIKRLDNLHNDTIARRETDYRNRIDHDEVEGDIELF